VRLIAQPAREIKSIQRWIVLNELARLPIHSAATAYVAGSSIKHNASLHVGNRFLLKADFSNFFPSIKANDIYLHIQKHLKHVYGDDEIAAMCRFLLWQSKPRTPLELCIGAPFISNTLMYEFDLAVENFVTPLDILYTRYADDLSFSTNNQNILKEVMPFLRITLRELQYPTIFINDKKTIFTSKKRRRTVTGLVLANQGYVSLGRQRKREIHAMVHRFSLKRLDAAMSQRLCGLLAFVEDVEPTFLLSLRAKYSNETIDAIRRFRPSNN
jgi:hypothetical protein